jgi:catalase
LSVSFRYTLGFAMVERRRSRMRLACTVAVAAAVGWGAVAAYAGGWPATARLFLQPTAAGIVDEFEALSGRHPGFRRNHAKGVCVSGRFESNGNAAGISYASVFESGLVVPVMGRFSIPGVNPAQQDGRSHVRSLALSIVLPGGEQWRMGMNSVPVFAVATPAAFSEQLRALRPDARTGRSDPEKIASFRQRHPEVKGFDDWIDSHPPSSGYENGEYFSVNAFRFIDASGHARDVRWSMVPQAPYRAMADAQALDPDFLDRGLNESLAHGPLRWHLIITLAEPGDPTDDATRLWPQGPERQRIDAGTLIVERAQSQVDGACRDMEFDPTVLPAGIGPSDDPLLRARSAAYAESFKRRQDEAASF